MKRSGVWILCIVLLAWALMATVGSAYYYTSFSDLEKKYQEMEGRLNELQGELQEALTGKGELGEKYSQLLTEHQALLDKIVIVSIYIDYGNGSVSKYEDIPIFKGHPTVLVALASVAEIEGEYYPDMGILITSINGVKSSQEEGAFWLYYVISGGEFIEPMVAADKFLLHEGDKVLWNYTKF